MFKKLIAASVVSASLFAGAATAQDQDPFTGFYTVGEVGYENAANGFDQFIFGGAVGYNALVSDVVFVGGEGAFHGSSSGLVDFTWELTGNVGLRVDEDLALLARAGYREINTDGFGSDGDYTLGVGIQYALSDTLSLRPLLDTVAFDTIGVRLGVAYSF